LFRLFRLFRFCREQAPLCVRVCARVRARVHVCVSVSLLEQVEQTEQRGLRPSADAGFGPFRFLFRLPKNGTRRNRHPADLDSQPLRYLLIRLRIRINCWLSCCRHHAIASRASRQAHSSHA
jgi:hypothetical protein